MGQRRKNGILFERTPEDRLNGLRPDHRQSDQRRRQPKAPPHGHEVSSVGEEGATASRWLILCYPKFNKKIVTSAQQRDPTLVDCDEQTRALDALNGAQVDRGKVRFFPPWFCLQEKHEGRGLTRRVDRKGETLKIMHHVGPLQGTSDRNSMQYTHNSRPCRWQPKTSVLLSLLLLMLIWVPVCLAFRLTAIGLRSSNEAGRDYCPTWHIRGRYLIQSYFPLSLFAALQAS